MRNCPPENVTLEQHLLLQLRERERDLRDITLLYNCESVMRPPCELVVREILPAFRSLVAQQLIQEHDFSQMEAAEMLGTTQATVSYYLHAKRGRKGTEALESNSKVQSIIREFAERIADNRFSLRDTTLEFCKLCKALKGEDFVCEMHKHLASVPENCNVCDDPEQGRE